MAQSHQFPLELGSDTSVYLPEIEELKKPFSELASEVLKAIGSLHDRQPFCEFLSGILKPSLRFQSRAEYSVAVPNALGDLEIFLSNRWDSIQIAILKKVVKYLINLDNESTLTAVEKIESDLKVYEQLLNEKLDTFLPDCNNKCVALQPLPGHSTACIKIEAQPRAVSLNHIMAIKNDFFIATLGVSDIKFIGFSKGCTIVYFSLPTKDVWDVACHLLSPKLCSLERWKVAAVITVERSFTINITDRTICPPAGIMGEGSEKSRLQEDFEVDEKPLGSGTFGEVFKCKRREKPGLPAGAPQEEASDYAVKIMKLRLKKPDDWIYANREVAALTQLKRHANIVKYYDSWFEWTEPNPNPKLKLSDDSSDVISSSSKSEEVQADSSKGVSNTGTTSSSGRGGGSQVDQTNTDTTSSSGRGGNKYFQPVVAPSYKNVEVEPNTRSCIQMSQPYLVIRMELCGEGLTLRGWLDEAHKQKGPVVDFFEQILAAVEHIHAEEMIHRDLKPANIFIMKDGRGIKVGDFGLMTSASVCVEGEQGGNSRSVMERTAGVGTPPYSSPEQVAGKKYGSETDIFALGIILFEMNHPPFRTDSERYQVLADLKAGKFPDDFQKYLPVETLLIREMLSSEPTERPSARDIKSRYSLAAASEPLAVDLLKKN